MDVPRRGAETEIAGAHAENSTSAVADSAVVANDHPGEGKVYTDQEDSRRV
jgi:hypothetical protein